MRAVFIEVDHRHDRAAVHAETRLTWEPNHACNGRHFFEPQGPWLFCLAVGARGMASFSRAEVTRNPSAGKRALGRGTSRLVVLSTKLRGEMQRTFFQPEEAKRLTCTARPRALLSSGWHWDL